MKPAKIGSCAIAYGLSLCLAPAQSPTVLTPGTSIESVEAISGGTRTTFSLTGNTILSWNQLNLAEGSELVYDFQSGERVLNILSGSNRHTIDGVVTSNGIVGFFSPNANFDVRGSITAKEVVLSTLSTNENDFFSGNGFSLSGRSDIRLSVEGNITATDGDVVLAGNTITVMGGASVEASDSVLLGAGTDVGVLRSGEQKLSVRSGDGVVLNIGEIRGSDIEIVAGPGVANGERIDAGEGQVFIEVGNDMQITNDSNAVILGGSIFTSEAIQAGTVIIPNEGDSASGLSSGTLNIPVLKRPDGSVLSEKQTVSTSVPVSATGDGGRDYAKAKSSGSGGKSASNSKGIADARGAVANRQNKASLLKRSSFFGVRGGQGSSSRR